MSDGAVIGGTGSQGLGLALRWAMAGLDVTIGSRDAAKAAATVREASARLSALRPDARLSGASNAEAVASAPLVVLSVPVTAHADTLRDLKGHLPHDAILIDITVPLAASLGVRGGRLLGLPAGSAAEQAAELAPPAARVVAAFHMLSAEALNDLERPVECDAIVCGEKSARERVRALAEAITGVRYVDGGPLYNARLVEASAALLIGLNIRYKARRAGLRITGLPLGSL